MARYFTSDWHLNETRIGEFNPFFRPFKNVGEQNETIIGNLNRIVQPNDELYHLGDVAMDEKGVRLLDLIRCQNKTLIVGNYDENKVDSLAKYFKDIKREMNLKIGTIDCYLNHYPVNHVSDRFNITGHIHSLWKVKPNMVNVGVDAWHFRPVSEKEILFVHNAIQKKYYDDNVFVDCIKKKQ
jgi:calcineurin-like phosphoesterase family protein